MNRARDHPPPASSTTSTTSFETVNLDDGLGIGLSQPKLNHGIRRKLDAMNKLHSTGVQVDIDLPQIVVIGNQSAGKSSLIEAISGITLPRAAGTCTRCPTECRLAQTDTPWRCIVSLRFTTDASGQTLGQARNIQFGEIIYEKSEVEDRIRRAQHAILNPSRKPEFFLTETDNDAKVSERNFSKNCITLQISGPDVADLSFCDLPGLIASVSTGQGSNDNSIRLVEDLVSSYIKKPSCIILLTVACETDFENQGAHRLAKQFDPEGKRTIGVLTKPDRIPAGEESSWLPFIRDEKEQLENNWFCVKQPSSMELKLKMTWAQTRQMENTFFSARAPWFELEVSYKKYLGTDNLVERLSNVLSDLITTRMPEIQDELERSIAQTREGLQRLPPPPTTDPRSEILTMLHNFTRDLALHIKGIPDGVQSANDVGLIQAIRPEQEKFKRAIRHTAPNFWPFERSANGSLPPAEFLRAEEGEVFETSSQSSKIYLDEVVERVRRARTRELPGHYPFVVQTTFIEHITRQWEMPAEALCKSVHIIMSRHAKQLVQEHFEGFGQGKLAQQVRNIMQIHINECLQRAEERVKWLQRLEDVPFSLNTHYLSDYRDKYFAYYKGARDKQVQANRTKSSVPFSPIAKPASGGPPTNDLKFINNFTPVTLHKPADKPALARFSFGKPAEPLPQLVFPPSNAPTFGPVRTTTTVAPPPVASTSSFQRSEPAPVASLIPPEQMQAALMKVLSGLNEMGMTDITEADLPKLLPPDPMEPALVIMADVRAYSQVAYKRFADNVPLAIDVELVRGVETDLLKTLFAQLGINGDKGDAICKELAQENRKIADRRTDLKKKLERLENAHLELFSAFV